MIPKGNAVVLHLGKFDFRNADVINECKIFGLD